VVDRHFDRHVRGRGNVPEVLREEVRALLFDKRRGSSLQARCVVYRLRIVAALDAPFDQSIPGAHLVAGDSAVRRKGKGVRQFERDCVAVGEVLAEDGPGDAAAGLGRDGDAAKRQLFAGR